MCHKTPFSTVHVPLCPALDVCVRWIAAGSTSFICLMACGMTHCWEMKVLPLLQERGTKKKKDESYVLIFSLWNNRIGVCNVSPTFKGSDNTMPHTFKGPLRNMIHTPADCGSSSITFSLTREIQCSDYSSTKGFRLQYWYCRWRLIDVCAQMEFWSARYQRLLLLALCITFPEACGIPGFSRILCSCCLL